MKGITPVIAIILLLLITISMVGFAFVWFQRVATTATTATDVQLQSQLNKQGQTISIEGAYCSAGGCATKEIYMRNSGTVAIPIGAVAIFVNGSSAGSGCPATSVTAGATFTCTATIAPCSGSTTVKATSPGNVDQITC
ncbi:MAG: archaellin/type IV pilin N-terminal domain-containing protein [Candidatus Aenigmatarchaeota archaeon]